MPAQTVVTQPDAWKALMDMQKYLGNIKGTISFDQVIDNSLPTRRSR